MVAYATTTHSYAETPAWVEVEPGVQRRIDRCTVNDLAKARQVEAQKIGLRAEAEMLLADAARHGIDVDDDLREQLAIWRSDLPGITSLVGELRGCLYGPLALAA